VTTYFVDTSALFKRYLPELGSERMESLFRESAEVFISTLATGGIQALTVSSDRGLNQLVAALGMRFLYPAREEPSAPTA
jgi:predicted nucleic acid-binding protein